MSVTNVYHKTRDLIHKMNFSASGETSWSFTQEGDGEIYDVEMVNVTSYTIEGSAVTLPYAVVSGQPYAVSIVKTTAGQPASITFKTRRSISKIDTINVPDSVMYDGSYFFALKDNNVLVKIDRNLLSSPNTPSAGVWAADPVVGSVTLPTLPSGVWNGCHFGNGKVICIASESVGDNIYCFCLVDYNTMVITDLDDNVSQYTSLILGGVGGGVSTTAYNYIRNQLLFRTSNGVILLDIDSKTIVPRMSGTAAFDLVTSLPKSASFNPTNETYTLSSDLLESNFENYAINHKSSRAAGCAYNRNTNVSYLNDAGNRLNGYNSLGQLVETRAMGGLYGYQNIKWIKDDLLVAFNTSGGRYIAFSKASSLDEIIYSTIEGYETNMYMRDIAIGGDVVLFKNNLESMRLFVFDAETKTYTGYLDLIDGTNIVMICASQHI